MRRLELLAPARNADIGIAAIDCGADAVYIAGPMFGARQAAGNTVDDIRRLCIHAHRYGARIFVTLNTILFDSELGEARRMMEQVRDAGADAIIVQDMAVPMMAAGWGADGKHDAGPIGIPLHASTQCAIRTPQQARFLESLGFSRLILERELSLEQIRAIRDAVQCELEFFVHGALCVCYSGQCYLSEMIAGRSANRGACIQACRSRYDLKDTQGRTIASNKALLSLKDYNLKDRIEDIAAAGVVSFKIEGRLKNESYVRNVVREYSLALDALVAKYPDRYARASFGKVAEGFVPDPVKTFNRGYTELFLDGKRGQWTSGDAAKGMGEEIGTVERLSRSKNIIEVRPSGIPGCISLNNGDGFSFVSRSGEVIGFRGNVCSGLTIKCKTIPELFVGARLYRNLDTAFEKAMEKNRCVREITVNVELIFSVDSRSGEYLLEASALTEDGRSASASLTAGTEAASNQDRMLSLLQTNISKSSGIYSFRLAGIVRRGHGHDVPALPFMPVSAINAIRRDLAEAIDRQECIKIPLHKASPIENLDSRAVRELFQAAFPEKKLSYKANIANRLSESLYIKAGAEHADKAYEILHQEDAELMRTRYCIRHELGLCPKLGGKLSDKASRQAVSNEDLFLLNNGRRLTLHFDCRNCEMVIKQ